MEHTNITEKILSTIENKQVTPLPKWFFIARNTLLWIPGVITTVLGAYTIAGVLYGVLHPHPNALFLIAIIPLLRVISFMIFCLVSISLLRATHTGYRHSTLQLLLVSVAASIILGLLFYALTQDTNDNKVRTLYRYPTQHQEEYFGRKVSPQSERNIPLVRIN